MQILLNADIPRRDSVVQRLFPDAYEAEEDARAYHELVGDQLRDHKLRALRVVRETLGDGGAVDATLADERVEAWLTVLTDMRLAIGTRLDVTDEKMAQHLEPDDPDSSSMAVLHWLGWLQQSILERL